MANKTSKEGFTLVELSLAMVFISLLALAIVLIITNTISSYRKGLTMSQINTTGSEIVDDIRVAIQNSSANSIKRECGSRYDTENSEGERVLERCENDGGKYLVSVTQYKTIKVSTADKEEKNMPVYGAICTGTYSYIWNSGYAFSKTSSGVSEKAQLTVNGDDGDKNYTDFRLLKVRDEKRFICSSRFSKYPVSTEVPSIGNDFYISKNEMGNEEPEELLSAQSDLAIYNLEMMAPAETQNGTTLFYQGSFILGTIQGGADIKASGNNGCKAPSEATEANFDYCAINKFNFAARTGGEG